MILNSAVDTSDKSSEEMVTLAAWGRCFDSDNLNFPYPLLSALPSWQRQMLQMRRLRHDLSFELGNNGAMPGFPAAVAREMGALVVGNSYA